MDRVGFKAYDSKLWEASDGWPLDSTEIAVREAGATLPEWLSRTAADARPPLLTSLTALPDLSALTSLQKLYLNRCSSLTALPDLSALTSLKTLNLL